MELIVVVIQLFVKCNGIFFIVFVFFGRFFLMVFNRNEAVLLFGVLLHVVMLCIWYVVWLLRCAHFSTLIHFYNWNDVETGECSDYRIERMWDFVRVEKNTSWKEERVKIVKSFQSFVKDRLISNPRLCQSHLLRNISVICKWICQGFFTMSLGINLLIKWMECRKF